VGREGRGGDEQEGIVRGTCGEGGRAVGSFRQRDRERAVRETVRSCDFLRTKTGRLASWELRGCVGGGWWMVDGEGQRSSTDREMEMEIGKSGTGGVETTPPSGLATEPQPLAAGPKISGLAAI
jgi:hypothetical protein